MTRPQSMAHLPRLPSRKHIQQRATSLSSSKTTLSTKKTPYVALATFLALPNTPHIHHHLFLKAPCSSTVAHTNTPHLQTLKRNIRLFRLVSRIATLILSTYTTYTQALSLHRFLTTRDIVISGRNAWAKQTTIWPTCVLLATSALTCIVALITIGTYFRSIKTANRTSATLGTATTIVEMAAHLAVWIGAAAAYRIGKTESDLWGWTCSDKADAIQEQFQNVVDFGKLCDTQVCGFFLCSSLLCFYGVLELKG